MYKTFFQIWKLGGICGILLLLRPILLFLLSRKRDFNEYSVVDFSALVFILYSMVGMFFACKEMYCSNKSKFTLSLLYKTPLLFFVLYTFWGLVSMAWTVNIPLTGYRAFECFTYLFMIVATLSTLFSKGNTKLVFQWSMLFVTVDIIFSILLHAKRAFVLSYLLESSQMMSTTFFFMAFHMAPRRWYHWLTIFMATVSMSTVAYIGMALGMVSFFWKKSKTKFFAFSCLFMLLMTTIIIGPYAVLKNTVFYDKEEISFQQTSGRDHLMEATLDCLDQYPMGLGFFAGEPYWIRGKGLNAISAHNSLFSAAISMGYIGLILMSSFFLSMFFILTSKYVGRSYKPILIGCFCVAFMHCMGNPSIGSRVFGAWIPTTYIFALICSFYVNGKYRCFPTQNNGLLF